MAATGIRTPNIDRMAAEGQRWTSFYAAPVCTPSRAQLLTGRLAIRTGLASGVLFPDSTGGLQPGEITIPETLKTRGYATAAIGKWHLGVVPEYLPTRQGFNSYFGGATLSAVRRGPYKAHFVTPQDGAVAPAQLYNLDVDPSERFRIADEDQGIIAELQTLAEPTRRRSFR